jgi:hypothetical protein
MVRPRGLPALARPAVSRIARPGPARLLWHTDPSCGDPDDDLAAAALKALAAEQRVAPVGAVVNRRPAATRAAQFAATLAALGLTTADGRPVPVGTGANVGRPMPPLHPGAPQAPAPAPVDGRVLQEQVLRRAPDRSVTLLVTTALTDLDWLLARHGELALAKLRAVTIMADAVPAAAGAAAAWKPGDATNCTVDLGPAARAYAVLQLPAWRHVTVTVVSRWAVLAGGEVPPAFLDELAACSPVAAWLRSRAAASMDERWASFCRGAVPGRSRASFVASHLGGRDPGRTAEEPVFDLLTGIPVYDAVAAIAAAEPHWFAPASDPRAPNFQVIGTCAAASGVRDPAGLRDRLAGLLRQGFGGGKAA